MTDGESASRRISGSLAGMIVFQGYLLKPSIPSLLSGGHHPNQKVASDN
jgi:hypothetical protein